MSLSTDQVRALDQLRQRLTQLSTSIQALQADLTLSDPLPTPTSLLQSAQLLAYNQSQAQALLSQHRSFFTAAHSYPLPSFPGHTQEGLLTELMRKKLEPRAETWIDRYLSPEIETKKASSGLSDLEARELWSWAGPTSNSIVRSLIEDGAFEDDFTLAEREAGVESVVTGLKRNLKDEESDDEAGDQGGEVEDKMEDVQSTAGKFAIDLDAAPMPIEKILRFMSTAAG